MGWDGFSKAAPLSLVVQIDDGGGIGHACKVDANAKTKVSDDERTFAKNFHRGSESAGLGLGPFDTGPQVTDVRFRWTSHLTTSLGDLSSGWLVESLRRDYIVRDQDEAAWQIGENGKDMKMIG